MSKKEATTPAVEAGQKCKVTVNGNLVEAVVRYVGKIKTKDGIWAGVELKTPGSFSLSTLFQLSSFLLLIQ